MSNQKTVEEWKEDMEQKGKQWFQYLQDNGLEVVDLLESVNNEVSKNLAEGNKETAEELAGAVKTISDFAAHHYPDLLRRLKVKRFWMSTNSPYQHKACGTEPPDAEPSPYQKKAEGEEE